MRRVNFLIPVIMLNFFSFSVSAQDICSATCADGYKDVAVTFASSSIQYDIEWEMKLKRSSWHFWSRTGQIENLGVIVVDSTREIRKKIAQISNSCQRIKFLGLFGHGDVGKMRFGYSTLSLNSVSETFGGLSCVMSSDAKIDFHSCNIARSCMGLLFITEIANALLSKGGQLTAPTSYAQQYPLVPDFTFNFSPEKLEVDNNGVIISSNNTYSFGQCLEENISTAQKYLKRAKWCGMRRKIPVLRKVISENKTFLEYMGLEADLPITASSLIEDDKIKQWVDLNKLSQDEFSDGLSMLNCLENKLSMD